jgi:hypothetical protein
MSSCFCRRDLYGGTAYERGRPVEEVPARDLHLPCEASTVDARELKASMVNAM